MTPEQQRAYRMYKRQRAKAQLETLRKKQPMEVLSRSVRNSARLIGLDPAAVVELFERNGNACEACGAKGTAEPKGRVQVDHCHARGVFRGFLCGDCNRVAGQAGDDPARLEAIAQYLRERPAVLLSAKNSQPGHGTPARRRRRKSVPQAGPTLLDHLELPP
jgi:hypothetical protein